MDKHLSSRYSAIKKELDSRPDNDNWDILDTTENVEMDLTYADLFSGAGGFSVGARDAGMKKIFSVEIDKDASATISNNFKDSAHFNMPIEDLALDMISGHKVDIIFGGPPCQGFSVAGLRNPNDPRNKLFLEYARIVDYLKPKYLVLENVPGILTMDKGNVAKNILAKFKEIGYPNMSVRILEAATYGVPQLRTRAVFIANNLGISNPYPKELFGPNEYMSINSAIDDLKHIKRGEFPNHEWTAHSAEMVDRISKIPPGGSLYETFRDAYKRQRSGKPSMTVKENHGGCHVHYELDRVLSAREMARLQTFPDDYIFSGSFKRAYWQIGNAVPCLMAKHIALAIKLQLYKYEKNNNK